MNAVDKKLDYRKSKTWILFARRHRDDTRLDRQCKKQGTAGSRGEWSCACALVAPPSDPTGRQTCRPSLRLSLLDGCMCDAAHFCWLTSHTQELQEAPKPLKCLYFTMAWTYLQSASCVRQQWSTKRDLKGHRERSSRPIERYGRVRDSPPAPRTLSVPPTLAYERCIH